MDGDSLARMGVTLALLLGIPALLLVGLRKLGLRLPGQSDGGDRLGLVSRLALDGKHSLLLVRRDTREQLILLGPAGPTILDPDVKLSPADRAQQKRRTSEREAQVAANRAALLQTQAAAAARMRALVATARKFAASRRSDFARLVESEAPAAPTRRRATTPRQRPRRRDRAA